jgi:hypothetical protein
MEGFEPLGQESKERGSRNEKEKEKCNRIPNDLSPPQTPGCGEEAHLIYCAESKGTSEREF